MTNEKAIELLEDVKKDYLQRGSSSYDFTSAEAVEYAMDAINKNVEMENKLACLEEDLQTLRLKNEDYVKNASMMNDKIKYQEGQINANKYCLECMGKIKDQGSKEQISDDIYEKAVIKFGKTPQLIMAMEEMSELIQGLSKDIRGKRNEDNISEEIADVEIMLAQLKIIYQNDAEVKKWKTDKLFRLQARIEEV